MLVLLDSLFDLLYQIRNVNKIFYTREPVKPIRLFKGTDFGATYYIPRGEKPICQTNGKICQATALAADQEGWHSVSLEESDTGEIFNIELGKVLFTDPRLFR